MAGACCLAALQRYCRLPSIPPHPSQAILRPGAMYIRAVGELVIRGATWRLLRICGHVEDVWPPVELRDRNVPRDRIVAYVREACATCRACGC